MLSFASSVIIHGVDEELIWKNVIGIAEKQIYADAMTAASNPSASPTEGMREIRNTSAAGHKVSTFIGNVASWTSQFKLPVRHVSAINKGN